MISMLHEGKFIPILVSDASVAMLQLLRDIVASFKVISFIQNP